MDATIITADKLNTEQEKNVIETVKKQFSATNVNFLVNPEILGGMVVLMGDTRIDMSIKGYLEQLKVKLSDK